MDIFRFVLSIYIILLIAASIITTSLSIYSWSYREAPGARVFSGLMMVITALSLLNILVSINTDPLTVFFWDKLRLSVLVTVPLVWFAFAVQYTDRSQWLKPRLVLLSIIIPVTSILLIWTNESHELFYRNVTFTYGQHPALQIGEYGPWFYIHASYSYLLILIGMAMLYIKVWQTPHLYRKQTAVILIGVSVPLLANILSTGGFIPGLPFEITPLGFTLTGVIFSWTFLRYRVFELVPIARSVLIDRMFDGMIVLDKYNRIVDVNPATKNILGSPMDEIIGQTGERVLCFWHEITPYLKEIIPINHEIIFDGSRQQQHFDVQILPLYDQDNRLKGRLVVLHDITQRKLVEQELSHLNQVLEQRVITRTHDLVLAYDATLEGWARALEMRDHETGGHTNRVTNQAVMLASIMGIGADGLDNVRRGAVLHDIGKMGIPDGILCKPGPLTNEEWNLMHKHPRLGYEMLKPIHFLEGAQDIVLYHHEKWDGTGYPESLREEQIPLSARIFAIVDVWDAVTSYRPYRKAWLRKDALNYIQQQSGLHFDPQGVQAFIKITGLESA
jgi:putative nucleotidyltransferase with HDIG domain/PAS domain S-box-containing protein